MLSAFVNPGSETTGEISGFTSPTRTKLCVQLAPHNLLLGLLLITHGSWRYTFTDLVGQPGAMTLRLSLNGGSVMAKMIDPKKRCHVLEDSEDRREMVGKMVTATMHDWVPPPAAPEPQTQEFLAFALPPVTSSSPERSMAQVQARMQALQTGASPSPTSKRSAEASNLPREAQL
jgi:hypothetical protein